ncbi:2-dehydropantoate 2-reductase [Pseudoclavibacter endophyticus]|uniref:2-dehydropantoate 2-reductase n=1 Tax=Pseudoclavibacter endophyticus TaxID=1778590 RepID=A0A6H9WTA2_9MICO|nr:ketopantoate reductase family protein [Pseudoclavibacter endophyticus]KAB1649915.1 ketopantoate reductase family protein [Pseudoclavibacter endophyticus]GGA58764.1 2-dehydropantoate 2-reductase [Pseudoclavibacter endophyticus]
MRIGVIGAGGVGGAFAARLQQAGHDVSIAARSWTADAIATDGVQLTGEFGSFTARFDAVSTVLPAGVELALLATKVHDAKLALTANRERLRGVPLVVMQNGLGGLDIAARVLGGAHELFGALTLFAVTNRGQGRIHVTAGGETFLGAGREAPSPSALAIAAELDRGLPTRAIENFRGAMWTKLLINHVNAIPAITGCSVQEVSADPALCRILTRSMRETIAVGRAIGVRFAPLGKLGVVDIRALEHLPLGLAMAVPRRLGASFGPVPNYASTLQSIRRGQQTEIDELNGRVAALGRQHGVPTPVNRMLTAFVHRVERTGEFLSPGVLSRLVER